MNSEKALTIFARVLQQVIPISTAQAANFFSLFEYQEFQTDDFFVRKDQVCNRIGMSPTLQVPNMAIFISS